MKQKGRITVREAAKLAMVSGATLRTWIYDQRVDAIQYAHVWWVSEKSVREVLAKELP